MELQEEIQHRQLVDTKFSRMESLVNLSDRQGLQDHDCYRTLVDTYIETCGYDEYSLKHFNVLAELCNSDANAINLIKSLCPARD